MSTEQTPSTPTKITTSLEEEEVEDKAIADAVTASPLHMHVALGAVLPGKPLPIHNLSSRSSSRSRTSLRSHSRSPSPQQQQQQQQVQVQVPSSTASSTSMEFLDEDILTDKMGMLELESQPCHVKPLLEQQGKKLPSVNERMSEESLDDVHAFSDLRNVIRQIKNHNSNNNNNNNNGSGNSLEKESGNSGTISSASSDGARSIGGSSYVDQGHLLETLLEFEEDDDEEEEDTTDDDDDDNNDNKNEGETLKKKLKKKKEKSFKSHCDDKLEAKE
jgi:hypothetical protein